MTAATAGSTLPQFRSVRKFFRTPKGYLLIVFGLLALVAVPLAGTEAVLPGLLGATLGAAALDMAIQRRVRHIWVFPSGAILTGLIVGFIVSPLEPLRVPVATAMLAVASKHFIRGRLNNVFNPAALGLVLSSLIFSSAQSWWGALPDLGVPGALIVLAMGLFIADRVNKLPLVLVFLGAYCLLFTEASFQLHPAQVAEVFRSPDLQATLFFAFFMVDDPPTCPVKYRDQIIFGVIAAVVSYAAFVFWGVLYFLPLGLLVANAWEAGRKWWSSRGRFASAPA